MTANLLTARDGAILTITFDRPEKKNALTNAMYGAWAEALRDAADDAAIRCVVVTGTGGVFTAGNDIGDFAAIASGDLRHSERHVYDVLRRLAAFPKPLVAAVPGLAVGIGTTMLLHCDLVYLAAGARLSAPFVDLALVPEAASSLLLPQRIGHPRSFALFALGEAMEAEAACACGLANKVVPAGQLHETAMAATKRLMRDGEAIVARMAAEGAEFERRLKTAEAGEAFRAFAERRKPDYARF